MSKKTVKIYMMPVEYPCGPQSSCCGPMGQSEEVIQELKGAIEEEFNLSVEVINVRQKIEMSATHVMKLLNTFGARALPIIALDGDIVSAGNPFPEDALKAISQNLGL